MKKFLNSLIIIFVFMFIGIVNVSAINITGPDTAKAGGNINLSFSDATISTSPNYDSMYEFSYDNEDKVETRTSVVGFSGSTQLAFSTSSGSATYKLKNSKENYTITFTIRDKNSGEIKSKSVKVSANITESSSHQTTTTTTTQAPKSNNANLKSIVVKTSDDIVVNLSPTFSPSVYEYEASVASDVKAVNVEAIMEDSKANLVISNNVNDELIAGENNKITITVTAEDGTKKQYVVNVKREALTADATLSSLTIKEYKDFEFKSDKFNYVIKVKNNVNKLTLDYTLSDENAMAKVDGNKDLKDGSKVKITVTAQDGTKKVYTLEISKETEEKKETNDVVVEKNPLIIMGLSIIAFGLIGGIVYVIKK